jgi:enamine deaminase RidA (YjgF/YER057c/UK114 family)
MERPVTGPGNRIVTSPALAEPVGFAHAVVAGPGRTVYLGGQTAQGPDGAIRGDTLVEQFDVAAGNVVEALRATGGGPEDLVSMQIFVTDAAAYRDALHAIGELYRRHFGRHYPAMALFEVAGLLDPRALVEFMAVAVVADREGG